jgi:hypothetical protein
MRADEIVRRYLRHLAPTFEAGARIIRDEIRAQIKTSAEPSEPGAPPHSMGPYEESWQSTQAVVTRDTVSAAAFSAAAADSAKVPLAILLEYGTLKMAPRPHIRPGIDRARPKLRALFQVPR